MKEFNVGDCVTASLSFRDYEGVVVEVSSGVTITYLVRTRPGHDLRFWEHQIKPAPKAKVHDIKLKASGNGI